MHKEVELSKRGDLKTKYKAVVTIGNNGVLIKFKSGKTLALRRNEFEEKYIIWDLHKDRVSPNIITDLNDGEIFVFGSNLAGRHGKGAAKFAKNKFGAKVGCGEGYTGKCYALPTKDKKIQTLSIERIRFYVNRFIQNAKINVKTIHLVTEIGCGLAGYTPREIAPLFIEAKYIKNIKLPKSFWVEIL